MQHLCVHNVALTLNDVGDHEGGAGVVADKTATGQVALNLQCKQIPGERKTGRTKESVGGRKKKRKEAQRSRH